MDFVHLEGLASHFMKNRQSHLERETGSVYYHGQRTSRGIIELRKHILPDDASHDDMLRAAAMFHDIGKGIEPHAHYGALLAGDVLKDAVTPEELAEITRLIALHCDRKPGSDEHDVYSKLLQDADLLDHFGTLEIWMCFHYCAHAGDGIDAARTFYETEMEPFLAKHRSLLNFDISRAIYDDKAAFERGFAARLAVESQGLYYKF